MGPRRPTAGHAVTVDGARALATVPHRRSGAGQMLVLFVVSIFVLMGITAIVVDVSWYWANTPPGPARSGRGRPGRRRLAARRAGHRLQHGARRGRQERLPRRVRWGHGLPDQGRGQRPPPRRHDQRAGRHVLHEDLRDHLDPGDPPVQGGVRPAGPDGQPGAVVRGGQLRGVQPGSAAHDRTGRPRRHRRAEQLDERQQRAHQQQPVRDRDEHRLEPGLPRLRPVGRRCRHDRRHRDPGRRQVERLARLPAGRWRCRGTTARPGRPSASPT